MSYGVWFKLRRQPPATGVASCGTVRLAQVDGLLE